MAEHRTAAIVGATGGAGTTRVTLELAVTLARTGEDVAVLDASFGTQGLSGYVDGRIDPDITAVLTDEADLDDALYELGTDTEGRVTVCPAYAPFERLARAKTAGAAERLGDLVTRASERASRVLVDTPQIATNPAVAAATSVDRLALVAPATPRGRDAVQRSHGRLADVGTVADLVVANRGDDESPTEFADVTIPESEVTQVEASPSSATRLDTPFAPAIAAATTQLFERSLDIVFPDPGFFEREIKSRFQQRS